MPKLSIITINYNNLKGLKRTMASVVNQIWQEFEYIVIDGGSTDGSVTYIESQNEFIDYWVSELDEGIYNAMNKGIVKANGEYLLFLNSGDHFYNDKVLEQNHIFLDSKDIIYFNLQVIDKMKTFVKNYPEQLTFSYFIKDTLPHPATFIKKRVFDRVGFYDQSLFIVSDWKFFIESICKFNSSYVRINQTLSTFYLDGLSSEPQNQTLIADEKQKILNSEFGTYLVDISRFFEMEKALSNLKKSKKIKILIKLGLLNKFQNE
jgi:glycosyltransferase involved in cell wall biosynthesis